MTAELFLKASRKKWVFPSPIGNLNTEQLWDLPLKSNSPTKASLDTVARELHTQIQTLTQSSFVDSSNDPAKTILEEQLDLVKYVIATIKTENAEKANQLAKAQQVAKLRTLIANKQDEKLGQASIEELQAQLAELASAS
jgi:hypothetical protein